MMDSRPQGGAAQIGQSEHLGPAQGIMTKTLATSSRSLQGSSPHEALSMDSF